MQVSRIRAKPRSLEQGHIFHLNNLIFDDESGRKLKFENLYPYVDLTGIKFGIVLTQTCDLEHQKVPYITLGLLEPIKRIAKQAKQIDISHLFVGFGEKSFFCFESYKKYLADITSELIQNRLGTGMSHLFFLQLPRQLNKKTREPRYLFLNLTKLYPVRFDHHDMLLKSVVYKVAKDFDHLLGWKMAVLYGRVGVPEYDKRRFEKTLEHVAKDLMIEFKENFSDPIDLKNAVTFGKFKKLVEKYKAATSADRRKSLQKKIADLIHETRKQIEEKKIL